MAAATKCDSRAVTALSRSHELDPGHGKGEDDHDR
jgi:hypothetical protein